MTDNVYKKLNQARDKIHGSGLKKSGSMSNSRNGYFELSDFMPDTLRVFSEVGLCGAVSFTADMASLTIVNTDDPQQTIVFQSPMGTASLKGCHEVQNIGAVETYQRRYLWMAALEIVERDALDASVGRGEEPDQRADRIDPSKVPAPAKKAPIDPAAKINDKTRQALQDLIESTGGTVEQFCVDNDLKSLADITNHTAAELAAPLKAKQKEPA